MSKRSTEHDKGFAAGYAVACSMLFRIYGEADLAAQILRESGIPLQDFETSGLDAYDLEITRDLLGPAPASLPIGRL